MMYREHEPHAVAPAPVLPGDRREVDDEYLRQMDALYRRYCDGVAIRLPEQLRMATYFLDLWPLVRGQVLRPQQVRDFDQV